MLESSQYTSVNTVQVDNEISMVYDQENGAEQERQPDGISSSSSSSSLSSSSLSSESGDFHVAPSAPSPATFQDDEGVHQNDNEGKDYYYMSKKFCRFLFSERLYENEQDFLAIQ